jgi:hypothetical protein
MRSCSRRTRRWRNGCRCSNGASCTGRPSSGSLRCRSRHLVDAADRAAAAHGPHPGPRRTGAPALFGTVHRTRHRAQRARRPHHTLDADPARLRARAGLRPRRTAARIRAQRRRPARRRRAAARSRRQRTILRLASHARALGAACAVAGRRVRARRRVARAPRRASDPRHRRGRRCRDRRRDRGAGRPRRARGRRWNVDRCVRRARGARARRSSRSTRGRCMWRLRSARRRWGSLRSNPTSPTAGDRRDGASHSSVPSTPARLGIARKRAPTLHACASSMRRRSLRHSTDCSARPPNADRMPGGRA